MPAVKGAGAKPTPNVIKMKMGNPGKRPLKEEPHPPDTGIPKPPCHMDDYAQEEWERVIGGLYAMGVIFELDSQTLAAYCCAYSRWRKAEELIGKQVIAEKARLIQCGIAEEEAITGAELSSLVSENSKGVSSASVLVRIASQSAVEMVKFAAECALTPVARARMSVSPAKEKKSKFSGLKGGVSSI